MQASCGFAWMLPGEENKNVIFKKLKINFSHIERANITLEMYLQIKLDIMK